MNSLNFMTGEDPLSLDRIRAVLTRLEDTIIFGLIERAQFAHNPRIYQKGAFKELSAIGFEGSWLEWFLKETETFHGTPCFPIKSSFLPLTNLIYWAFSQGSAIYQVRTIPISMIFPS